MAALVDVERFLDRFRRPDGPIDEYIIRLADLQHGLVEISQLFRLGLTPDEIKHRIRIGLLTRIHRGVYAVGRKRIAGRACSKAATLAGSPDALSSHLSGGRLWDLIGFDPTLPEIVVPGSALRSTKDLRVHRMRHMHEDDRAEIDGIPVTSLGLTCLHLCGLFEGRSAERIVIKAARRREFDHEQAAALCARSTGRKGRRLFSAILGRDLTAEMRALSELELRFIEIVRRHGIPLPEINSDVEAMMVDAVWHDRCVVVELDGFEFHKLPTDLRRDNERNRALSLAGYRVIRYTWDDLNKPAKVARELRLLLDLAGRR